MGGNTITVIAAVVAAIGTLATAAATSFSAYQIAEIQRQTSDRQSDIEMVKLALNILGGDISDKTQESRNFAVSLLGKYSGVSIDEAVQASWAKNGTVAFSSEVLGLSPGNEITRQILRGYANPELGMPNPGLRRQELLDQLNKN